MNRLANTLMRGAALVTAFVMLLTVGALGCRAVAQARNADAFAIRSPRGIDQEAFVTLDGAPQWVTIRGEDQLNPAILIVGGVGRDGPGAVLSPFIGAFQPWERDFTVVQWDQPGAGKTFAAAGRTLDPRLSIDLITRDGLALTELLRAKLRQPKIILLGVGFGTTIAARMVLMRPDEFVTYVAAGQIANARADREQALYTSLLALAASHHDDASLADLQLSGPWPFRQPRDPAKVAAISRVWRRYAAPTPPHQDLDVLTAPHWSLDDALAVHAGEDASEARIGHEWGEHFDYASLGPAFRIPVIVIQGDRDYVAPLDLSRAWLAKISAPQKQLAVISGAGDHALQTHSVEFLADLDQLVRPLAVRSGPSAR